MTSASAAGDHGITRAAVAWVAATVVVGAVIPLGGFVVALASRHPRFASRRPGLTLLLVVATLVVVVQLVGLNAWWGTPSIRSGPAQVAIP